MVWDCRVISCIGARRRGIGDLPTQAVTVRVLNLGRFNWRLGFLAENAQQEERSAAVRDHNAQTLRIMVAGKAHLAVVRRRTEYVGGDFRIPH